MAGVKGLRKIQIGLEVSSGAGTDVAATAVLRYNGLIEDGRTVVFADEQVGILGGMDRQYTSQYLAKCQMTGEATFEQLPYFLNASIAIATASADGAGSGFIYEYPFPTTAKGTIGTYTIEAGDNQQAEQMTYGYVSEFTLSGKYGEAWMVDATWQGRNVETADFTAALTPGSVEEMLFGKTKLYIDDSTGTIGTTLKSNTLLSADLKYTSGWIPKFTADGELYFSFIENVGDECTLDITFEHDASSVAEKAAWRLGTGRKIRLLCEGTAFAAAGTAYTYKTLNIDLAGKWEKFEKIDEIDGNDVVKGTFRVRYTTDGTALKGMVTVVNALSALP